MGCVPVVAAQQETYPLSAAAVATFSAEKIFTVPPRASCQHATEALEGLGERLVGGRVTESQPSLAGCAEIHTRGHAHLGSLEQIVGQAEVRHALPGKDDKQS